MPTARVKICTGAFVAYLDDKIAQNLEAYRDSTTIVYDDPTFSGQKDIATDVIADLDVSFVGDDDKLNTGDVQNAILLHRALSFLTPAQATDERLWTRLAHVEFWAYMRRRWPVERNEDASKAASFIANRYFVQQSQGRALLRHGVARLWWAAHLTWDSARDNQYELTEVLLSRLDITQQILERSIGRSTIIRRGFLEFLLLNRETLLVSGEKSRYAIRRLAKKLNLMGGVNIIDFLNEADVIRYLSKEYDSQLDSLKTTVTA